MLRPEDYSPVAARDRFIDRSIGALLGVLAALRRRPGAGLARQRLQPSLQILAVLVLILQVALSRSRAFLEIAATSELLCLCTLSGTTIARVLAKAIAAAAFTLVIFLPFALWGNLPAALLTSSKVLMAVIALALLSATAPWTAISRGLGALRIPDLFILVLDLAIKYISLLGGMVLDMLYALRLRSVGRNRDKTASLSGVVGTLFVKSKEAADELYSAMRCRCFDGSYRGSSRPRFGLPDLALLGALLLLTAAFILLQVPR